MTPEEVESLILRSLTGTATPNEESTIQQWKDVESGNNKIYNDYAKILRLNDLTPVPLFDSEKEWLRLEKQVAQSGEASLFGVSPVWYRIAATVLLIVASIFIIKELTS